MSAYIVDNVTIDKILAFLSECHACNRGEIRTEDIWRIAVDGGCDFCKGDEGLSQFGQELLRMNTEAVNWRYDDDATVREYTYTPREVDITVESAVAAFKTIGCLSYQCMEGPVPETNPLYKVLTELKNAIATAVMYAMPEYARAPWG